MFREFLFATRVGYTPFKPGHRLYDLELQLKHLGLEDMRYFTNLKFLDIGCGNMDLLHHFWKLGVDAEGIAPSIETTDSRIMPSPVTNLWPSEGCIPRNSQTYDMVLLHSIIPLNHAFVFNYENPELRRFLQFTYGVPDEDLEEESEYSRFRAENQKIGRHILLESLRVLKRGGEARIFPALPYLERNFPELMRGEKIRLRHEKVDPLEGPAETYEIPGTPKCPEELLLAINSVTVLRKLRDFSLEPTTF